MAKSAQMNLNANMWQLLTPHHAVRETFVWMKRQIHVPDLTRYLISAFL